MGDFKYPRGECVWTKYYNSKHNLLFILTAKEARDYYYLYEVNGEGFKKLGKSKSPTELETKFNVIKKMRE